MLQAITAGSPLDQLRPGAGMSRFRRFAVDALVGGLAAASSAALRIAVEYGVGGVAPFILTFPAVMIATLIAGGRAGAIATVSCQLLTIRYVFPNWIDPHGALPTGLANVVLSTLALAGTVWATASYRRASALLRSQCEHQVHTLSLLISEMDHRTKNNFQIAAGLLAHQSISSPDPELARELERASTRLESIASVYQDLTPGVPKQRIDLADHARRIVTLLRAGAVPEQVTLSFEGDHVDVPHETAMVVGLIVNEWVTNALKHAFGTGPGAIRVTVARGGGQVRVIVHDDGRAHGRAEATGGGSSLMRSLAEVIHARIAVSDDAGTRCVLTIPATTA